LTVLLERRYRHFGLFVNWLTLFHFFLMKMEEGPRKQLSLGPHIS